MKGLKSKIFMLVLLVVLCATSAVFAVNEEYGIAPISLDDETMPVVDSSFSGVADHDVFIMEDSVNVNYSVDGNVFIMGKDVTISGTVDGNVFVLANNLTIAEGAYVYCDLYVCANNVTVNGYVFNMYSVSSKLSISSDSYIARDINSTTSNFSLAGFVGRDVNVSFSDCSVDDDASVGRDFNYSAPAAVAFSESVVDGNVNYTQIEASDNESFVPTKNYALDALKVLLISLVVILIVVLATPKFAEKEEVILTKKFGPALGYGALALIAIPIACIILFLTIIGILPSIIVLLAYILFIAKLTYAFVAIPLGRVICKKINKDSKGMNILFDCILVLAFWAISLIPFVGGLVNLIITLLAFGIITYSIFASKKLNADNVVASASAVVEAKKDDSKE